MDEHLSDPVLEELTAEDIDLLNHALTTLWKTERYTTEDGLLGKRYPRRDEILEFIKRHDHFALHDE